MIENIEILYIFISIVIFTISGYISRYCCINNDFCNKYCFKKINKNKIKNDISDIINNGIDIPVKEIINNVPIIGNNNDIINVVDKQIENIVDNIVDNIIDNYIPNNVENNNIVDNNVEYNNVEHIIINN